MDKLKMAACGIDCNECEQSKTPSCNGCWDKTGVCWCDDCGLRACCEEKQLDHCGECGDFPCGDYTKWVGNYGHHKAAMECLMSIKANHTDNK